jgi:peptidoglycan/LPS O-acetylase OafA/YrhL
MSSAPNQIHLKGLNGIRAIAAFSVVISHTLQSLVLFGLPKLQGIQMANYGVTMFFTLSGFLITFLLLLEKEKFGGVNIKQFYIRRILRIWPLYYFYLIVSIVVLFVCVRQVLTGNLVFYFFLLANVPIIMGNQIPVIGHYWSLGVEEQFYLFWPWIVKRVSRLLVWLIYFVAIMMVLKFGTWLFFHRTGNVIPLNVILYNRFQCMAIGACAAILYFQRNSVFLKIAFKVPVQLMAWTAIAVLAAMDFNFILNDEIISFATVVLIVNISSNQNSIVKLENKPMDFLGKISYGVYIYHPLIIYLLQRWAGTYLVKMDSRWRYVAIFGLVTFITILVAAISYRFFESRFLRLKERFARVKSQGNRQLATG